MIDIINRDNYNNFSDRLSEVKRMVNKVNSQSDSKLVTLPDINSKNPGMVNDVYNMSMQQTFNKPKFANKLASIISTE